ncbi:MAG: hypothetical protein N2Z76_03510, partial [Treponemataceae bacterium]|nr:hypothetical protein [Treponemataceae bacterium]
SAILAIGENIRPFFRIEGTPQATTIIQDFVAGGIPKVFIGMLDKEARFGVGLALDAGLMVQIGHLEMGLTVRDMAFPFSMGTVTYQETLHAFSSLSLPRKKGPTTTSVQLVPDVHLGFRWAPYGLPGLLEPMVLLEIQDPISVVTEGSSVGNLFHLGFEVKTLSFLSLRMGLNKGWFSGGVALSLVFCTIEGAIFTEELGLERGAQPRSGFSLTTTLHF